MEAKLKLEELYRRAAADPQSISRAERNAIWNHPPPEEEDRLCVANTGRTPAELLAKALVSPDELTHLETKILCHSRGVNYDIPYDECPATLDKLEAAFVDYLAKPAPLEKLRNEAVDRLWATRSADEVNAMLNANAPYSAFEWAEMKALQEQSREADRARQLKIGTP
jgi:hypothetical protein